MSRRFHKLTTDLRRKYDRICVEDLNIKGMAKAKLSRSVLDSSFGEFVYQVEYKAQWSFQRSIEVGRFFASNLDAALRALYAQSEADTLG